MEKNNRKRKSYRNHKFNESLCQEPFDLISITRNFERPLTKILKNIKNQEQRLLNGKLRNLFGRWRKKIGNKNIKTLKTNLIYKTKNSRKGPDVNFPKGINILTKLYRKPNDILDAYTKKVEQISKLKGANNLVKLRRIIKHNEEEPRAKAFHIWANQVKVMQFRDKDMEKACIMIGNTLGKNYKS